MKKTERNSEIQPHGTFNRRQFIGGLTVATAGVTVIPAQVLGGRNHVAPSDKVNIAYIGCGTQGLRELPALIEIPDVQVVAVCDPQKEATGYYDWSSLGLRNSLRKLIKDPAWETGTKSTVPGGRNNGKEIVEAYYARIRPEMKYKGCRAYADFREMFEKEKGIDAVKIMTPDHLHGLISMAAIKRGKHVTVHKPLSNRLYEAAKVIGAAGKSKVTTHLIPWDTNGDMDQIMAWISNGVIGTMREIHNWTNRPVWPQYPNIPTENPPVPKGFDWDLWLGPEAVRPYHPCYTNMVFRGWYDFGGGSMADMGHYSLWTVFKALELENPIVIETNLSHVCGLRDDLTAFRVPNNYSFPFSSMVRFKYPAKGFRPPVDLIWYDGGMKPPVPGEFYSQNREFPAEGMMFVGDRGKIISEFVVKNPTVISGDFKLAEELTFKSVTPEAEKTPGVKKFIDGCLKGEQISGNFREAWPITEAVNLYAVALRTGKTLRYDPKERKITNIPEANRDLDRDYRKGWEIDSI